MHNQRSRTPLPTSKIIIFCLIFGLSLASFLLVPLSQPAAEAQAPTATCAIKVNKDKCEDEVKRECSSTNRSCGAAKAAKYADVYKVCRAKQRPQACHVKARDECKGKAGGARRTCQKEAADRFDTGSSAAADKELSLDAGGATAGQCGSGDDAVKTRFDFGCTGKGSPIVDLAYSLIRFLSFGVGLVLVASIIYAGIMYSSSEGNPEATHAAKKRVQNAVIGLIFYLFIFAFVQYIVPGGLFA